MIKIKKLFCFGLFVLGVAVFLYGVFPAYFAYRSVSWTSVPGVVIQSKLSHEKGITRAKKGTRSGRSFAHVEYEYSIDGVQYNNNEIFYGYRGDDRSSGAKDLLNLYPLDSVVTVYFDNSNPNHSVLQPGVKSSVWYYPSIGLAVMIVSLLGYVSLGRKEIVGHTGR